MNRKYTTVLAAVMVSLLALSIATAQDAGNSGGDRDHNRDRGKNMPQRGQRGQRGAEQMVSMLTRRLDLDESQEEQVRSIAAGMAPEFEALREKGKAIRAARQDLNEDDADYDEKLENLSANREEIATTGAELRNRMREEIDQVLTPEQREKFAASAERGRERGRRSHRRGGSRQESQ